MTRFTVASVQAYAIPGDVAGNAVTAAKWAREAATRGAELVVLPELFLSAYHPPALTADPKGTAVRADEQRRIADPRLDPLREAGITVVIGACVTYPDERRTCASLVVDRAGGVTAAYDKQHLWGDEKALFAPGDRGATLTIGAWRFGLGVCYDGCFPEHARAAVRDDVHGYLAPSAYMHGSQHRRDLYYAARALDNTMYVVFANAVGGVPPWRFNGGAAVYDPEGRCLARGDDEGEDLIVATLDQAEIAKTRVKHSMLADRLPDQGGERRQISS